MRKIIIILFSIVFIFLLHSTELSDIVDNYIRYNNWSESSLKLNSYLNLNPGDYEAHALLGAVNMETKEYEKAIVNFRTAITFSDSNLKKSQYYFNIGSIYYLINNHSLSEDMLKNSIEQNPMFASSYYLLGLISYEKGDNNTAVNYWRSYIRYTEDADKRIKISNVIRLIQQAEIEEKIRKENEERKRLEDEERRLKEEEERRKQEELRKAEEERVRKENEEKARKAEEERKKLEEIRRAEEERVRKENEEKARKAEEERKKLEEVRRAEEERVRKENEEIARKAEEERKKLEEIRRAEEEKRKNELLDFLKNQLNTKSEQATSLQEYRILKEDENGDDFQLID